MSGLGIRRLAPGEYIVNGWRVRQINPYTWHVLADDGQVLHRADRLFDAKQEIARWMRAGAERPPGEMRAEAEIRTRITELEDRVAEMRAEITNGRRGLPVMRQNIVALKMRVAELRWVLGEDDV